MNITIEKLMAVRTIVAHENCPDGIAAAMICRDALPVPEVVFCNYETPLHREMKAEPGMLFVDFSPHRSRVAEFVEAGAIVLDHHETQRGVVEAFGELGVYADNKGADPGVSGAMLAARHVWEPAWRAAPEMFSREAGSKPYEDVFLFAEIAGVRDTWEIESGLWPAACRLAAALKFMPVKRALATPREGWDGLLVFGEILLEKQAERVAEATTTLHRFKSAGGLRVGVTQGVDLTSDLAEALKGELDLLMGFFYKAERGAQRVVWSCRTKGAFKAKHLAFFYKGGGHDHAAGFMLDVPGDCTHNPFTEAEMLLGRFHAAEEAASGR